MFGFLLAGSASGICLAIAMLLSGWGIGWAFLAYLLGGWTSLALFLALQTWPRDI
jgi:hypothetical protein